MTGGTAAFALAVLLRLPGTPNCPAIFWPLASASLRFECARLAASKQTMKDLLEAIALLDSLPPDHPMREEADRLIEQWSEDVLRLAEEAFNAGKLEEAIASARRIPTKVSAYRLVEERIQKWQSIWSDAEEIYRKAEDELRQLNWRKAFEQAVRLLDVENKYWQTTKYDELTQRINAAREDGNKLAKAERLADEGGLSNLLEAIKLAQSINAKSYVYKAAQTAIEKFGRKMLDLAQVMIDQRDLQGALNILEKVPDIGNLKEEAKDWTALAYAQSAIWADTVSAYEDAISQAQKIAPGRPLYKKAQQLITRWQREIEAIAQLDKAKVLAQTGMVEDLAAAVAQASLISESNPRWGEAQKQIKTWTDQIQTIEDRPILDQADAFASQGDVASLQAAVEQANQVGRGRALSGEAQSKIAKWTDQIQRIQDQPLLDQARDYASAGNLAAAIATAEQIKPGRALHGEAQSDATTWRKKLQTDAADGEAQRLLQDARRSANSGSPDALAAAIQLANQVSGISNFRSEADSAMDDWSRQILQIAESRAAYDPAGAIAIAQKIPQRTAAFDDAQQQIQTWKKLAGQ